MMYTPVSRNGILFNVKYFMLSICLYCLHKYYHKL